MKRFLKFFRADRLEHDLTEEMHAHLEEKIDELIDTGMRPEEARVRAQRQFGNRTQLLEECRERWIPVSLDELVQDLRYAARVLRKSPGFTAAGVLSLALGIGANTIIFSAVNHVLLHPLPYLHSDRLFCVWSRSAAHGPQHMHVSAADFYDWQAQSHSFESVAAYANWPMNLIGVNEPRRLETELVSANLFSTLGVEAQIGRTFLRGEDLEKSAPVVVISHHLWRALGQSPGIVGKKLTLNGSAATVIGVMPATFGFPSRETDAWVPLSLSAQNRVNREGRWLSVIGRLSSFASRADAAAELDVISSRLARAYPMTNEGWNISLVPLQDQVVGKIRPILLTLQAGTFFLLLIACVNLANLLLAKSASRAREIGMRAALGADRARIFRQLVTESALLATLGGALGIGLAAAGIRLARTFGEGLIPRAGEIQLSASNMLFAACVALATSLVFGVAPALQASRVDLIAHAGIAARGPSRHVERQRGMLVAIEVGLAAFLLVGAGLLGESLAHLLSTSPGFRTDHLLAVRLTLSRSQYPTNSTQNAFFEQVLGRVATLPGVLAAGEISETPLKGNNPSFEFVLEGFAPHPSDPPVQAGFRAISIGSLSAVGIPLLRGREFTSGDRADSLPVAIVNETMARRCWPGSDPVGRRVRFKDDQRWMVVRGVAADIKHMGLQADEGLVVYAPYAQKSQDWLAWTTLLVRTAGEPLSVVPAIRAAIRDIDRNQPIAEIGAVEESLARSTAVPRITTFVLGTVSGFALLIALIGVYGLLAYTVARRFPEFGVRLTLGASPLQLSGLLIRQTMVRVLAGVAAGLTAAWWLSRWMESLLFGVRPHEPAIFGGVAGLLMLASIAAVFPLARRVVSIDPAAALRTE